MDARANLEQSIEIDAMNYEKKEVRQLFLDYFQFKARTAVDYFKNAISTSHKNSNMEEKTYMPTLGTKLDSIEEPIENESEERDSFEKACQSIAGKSHYKSGKYRSETITRQKTNQREP